MAYGNGNGTNGHSEAQDPRSVILQNSLREADDIQAGLIEQTRDFELAIERKQLAAQAIKEANRTYDELENELQYEAMYSDEYNEKGMNAEKRKIVMDRAIVKARQPGGPLHNAWNAKIEAERESADADSAYLQAETRFRGIRYAANLKANQLHAVAVS